MPILWLFLLRILKLDHFKCRPLTLGEIELCLPVFGDLVDYEKVKILNQPYLPWQPIHMFMAPEGYIHTRDENFSLDYSQESKGYQAIFIHEMTHVFQHQQGINVLLQGAILQTAHYLSFRRYNPYRYTFDLNKKFWQYNIEQQGDIARDIFLGKIPNIIIEIEK